MSNYKIEINAINMRDLQIALKDWCETMSVMPDFDPIEVMDSIDLDTLVKHLERRMAEAGFTVNIRAIADEVVEVKAPKRARKEKAAESVLELDAADPRLEALKQDVIRRLQALYMNGGKDVVNSIIERHGNGETKLANIPAAAFGEIAKELEDELD